MEDDPLVLDDKDNAALLNVKEECRTAVDMKQEYTNEGDSLMTTSNTSLGDKTLTENSSVKLKISKRAKYKWDFCEYMTTQRCHLKLHTKGIHFGIRYPCDLCEYIATQPANLKRHRKVKYEGNRLYPWPCDQCEYAATEQCNLKQHKEAHHQGIRYPCDQCKFSATRLSALKQRKKTKHGVFYTLVINVCMLLLNLVI